MGNRVIILDSSAIINGYNPLLAVNEKQIMPACALNEILQKDEMEVVERAVELNKLELINPKNVFIVKVMDIADKTKDITYLSEVDISTIALALEFKELGYEPIVVTDDFSIQNILKYLEIKYLPVITRGIKRIIMWKLYCPACKREYYENIDTCSICGAKLKRKPRF
ncbi:MAG: nucleotide-binding protein [Candidatus Methanomethylicia archaeon]|nr:nucleotide-binding protein [Candidatus Methanomethylicia archaeon]MCX8169256.1 nucleotide-binding protein [Candidatus Methanomethylicia archaeon]MDW7988962.1 nucleotide-binding protein [Nitrososphaerota archaeon]